MLRTAAMQIIPRVLSIGATQRIKSSDPYAVDRKFLTSLFAPYMLQPSPKTLLDPLGVMRSNLDFNIATGSGGNAIVCISPQSLPWPSPIISAASTWYPYVSVSSSNTGNVYNGAFISPGPFNGQLASLTGWFPDQCKVQFQCSQSMLNASGRIFCGIFYQNPNLTFATGALNTYDALNTTITPSQI